MQESTYGLRLKLLTADGGLEDAAANVAGIADGEEADGPLTSAVQMIQDAQGTIQGVAGNLYERDQAKETSGHALCDAADAVLALYAEMTPDAPEGSTDDRVITLMDAMDDLRAVLGNPDEDCEIDVFYTIDGPPWADVRYEDREEAISLGKRQGRAVIEHTSRHTDTVVYEPDEAEGDKSARQRMVERGQ